MRIATIGFALSLLGFCTTAPAFGDPNTGNSESSAAIAMAKLGKLPFRLEPNTGQFDAKVRFRSRNSSQTILITQTGFTVEGAKDRAGVSLQFENASQAAQFEPLALLPGATNYFRGNNPKDWHTNIPGYAKVLEQHLYPGVDVVYYGNPTHFEYDLVLNPGADIRQVRFAWHGADSLAVSHGGELILNTKAGEIRQSAPKAYQDMDGARVEVASAYRIENGHIQIELGNYDASRKLIIDPIVYSTYLGGAAEDLPCYLKGGCIAVGADHSVYVTGQTNSTDFPVASPDQASLGGNYDVFVTHIDASGSQLISSTYLGGSADDEGYGLATDDSGIYLTGSTKSADFPETGTVSLGGSQMDAFVFKLNPSGTTLLYSRRIGGVSDDAARAIALAGNGRAIIFGDTNSFDFPLKNSLKQPDPASPDAFLLELDPSGNQLLFSTRIGGAGYEYGWAVTLDGTGSIYVAGETTSTDFPQTAKFGPFNGGGYGAFVTKLNRRASKIVYSTIVGGTGFVNEPQGIGLDATGAAYVSGNTNSTDFPTVNAVQAAYGGKADGFMFKLSPDGGTMVYSTYLGGSDYDYGYGIAVTRAGRAFSTGFADSTNFPLLNPIQTGKSGRNAYVTELSPNGKLLFSTLLGGNGDDWGFGLALDDEGAVYLTGFTASSDFPTVNAFQRNQPNDDGFIMKFTPK